jgi:hypothetical protein
MKIRWWYPALAAALLLAVLSPVASASPDGLERVAGDMGFAETAGETAFRVIPDYFFPGLDNGAAATIVAGLVGTLLVLAITLGLAELLKRKSGNEA